MDSLLTYAQENSGSSSTISTLFWIASIAGMWKMFEKAGEQGWKAIIPFYNQYILCDKVMKNPWYWIRLFVVIIPVIGWIAYVYFQYQIGKATAKAYGQPESWAWGYTFIPPIFYCITGFGQYKYYGPFGIGDRRTGEARQAKTVDFDVVKNEPYTQARPSDFGAAPAAGAKPSEPAESVVDFDFNQSDKTHEYGYRAAETREVDFDFNQSDNIGE